MYKNMIISIDRLKPLEKVFLHHLKNLSEMILICSDERLIGIFLPSSKTKSFPNPCIFVNSIIIKLSITNISF